jgi:hypothetical protein
MKKLITLFAASMMLLSVGAQAESCSDDPRLKKVGPLVKAIKKGESIDPLKITYGTYLGMNAKLKSFLSGGEGNPNFDIMDHNCESLIEIDGEVITKVEMPIETIEKHLLNFQNKGDTDAINNLIKNVKAKDVSVETVIGWVTDARNSAYEKSTVCHLTDAGILRIGYITHFGTELNYKSCLDTEYKAIWKKPVGHWEYPYRADLFAGFGGQVIGNDHHMVISGTWGEDGSYANRNQRLTIHATYKQNGVAKSVLFHGGQINGQDSEILHNGNILIKRAALMNINVSVAAWSHKQHTKLAADYEALEGAHKAIIAAEDTLAEDDGSEKE